MLLLDAVSVDGDELEPLAALATGMRYRRGQQILGARDPAAHWYRLVWGMARQCAFLSGGRRQIVAFYLPGDFFGFSEGIERFYKGDNHHFAVEAVVEGTVVARYSRPQVEALVAAHPALAERIRTLAFESIARLQARMLTVGRMTALERVGAFLLEMAGPSPADGNGEVVLPMSRYDIADYLALSVETVSRTLTDLRLRGVIDLPSTHRVRIADPSALAECA